MGQAIVVHDAPDAIITIDSDVLEELTEQELAELIAEAMHALATGESEFAEVEYAPTPTPVYPQ